MKITLSHAEALACQIDIRKCIFGEMCKIAEIKNLQTGKVSHIISSHVTGGGWEFGPIRSFHGTHNNGKTVMTGLGTFYLISHEKTDDGGYVLEFTEDLNPDMP